MERVICKFLAILKLHEWRHTSVAVGTSERACRDFSARPRSRLRLFIQSWGSVLPSARPEESANVILRVFGIRGWLFRTLEERVVSRISAETRGGGAMSGLARSAETLASLHGSWSVFSGLVQWERTAGEDFSVVLPDTVCGGVYFNVKLRYNRHGVTARRISEVSGLRHCSWRVRAFFRPPRSVLLCHGTTGGPGGLVFVVGDLREWKIIIFRQEIRKLSFSPT